MLLLLNEKRGMNGGSGECEGMSVDGDGSGGMGIDVDIDKSKKNMVFGDEYKDGTGIGDTGCDDTDILRKAWASTMKLFR
jgi:hypothetical protein